MPNNQKNFEEENPNDLQHGISITKPNPVGEMLKEKKLREEVGS